MLRELVLSQAMVFALIASRISGFIVTSPFPSSHAPPTQRVALVVVLTVFATSMAPLNLTLPTGLDVVPLVLRELGLGAAVGLVFRTLLAAASVAGEMVSQGSALGAPSLFDPSSASQQTVITRIFSLFAVMVAVAMGAHRVVFAYLLESFVAVPPGSDVALGLAGPVLAELINSALVEGLRLSMPAIAVSLAIQVGLAIVARVAPSLQIFNMGFAILIGAGLLTMAIMLPELAAPLAAHIGTVGDQIDTLLSRMGGAR